MAAERWRLSDGGRAMAAGRWRPGDGGRAWKVGLLEDEVLELCLPVWAAELPPLEGPVNDYRLLCNELMRLLLGEELFTFVTAAPVKTPAALAMVVPGTSNETGSRTTAAGSSATRRSSLRRRACG